MNGRPALRPLVGMADVAGVEQRAALLLGKVAPPSPIDAARARRIELACTRPPPRGDRLGRLAVACASLCAVASLSWLGSVLWRRERARAVAAEALAAREVIEVRAGAEKTLALAGTQARLYGPARLSLDRRGDDARLESGRLLVETEAQPASLLVPEGSVNIAPVSRAELLVEQAQTVVAAVSGAQATVVWRGQSLAVSLGTETRLHKDGQIETRALPPPKRAARPSPSPSPTTDTETDTNTNTNTDTNTNTNTNTNTTSVRARVDAPIRSAPPPATTAPGVQVRSSPAPATDGGEGSVITASPPSTPRAPAKTPPPAPPKAEPRPDEAVVLKSVYRRLRQSRDPAGALTLLDGYDRHFGTIGALRSEALLARIEALLARKQHRTALSLLDRLAADRAGLQTLPRGRELRVLRAELLAQSGRCPEAEVELAAAIDAGSALPPSLLRRAEATRASCKQPGTAKPAEK